ncbi:MAG TPA: helix-turn-helix domain-containing protein [Polyangiaceae bacterium]|nr:helix-turn-helix domain-containing protein [Polyangiaceae bacterium]
MAQVQKPEVREAFVAAAARTFAELGYDATTMGAVASRAGSSIGNLYKYFSSKDQLFAAAVPEELVRELSRRTRARMRALGAVKDVRELEPRAEYHALAGDLLDYCLANRAAVVVVLARAEGTPFAGFKRDFVSQLVKWALDYARGAYPELRATAELRFALEHAYQAFVSGVAAALRAFSDEAQARAVIARLTAQHQGGLKRLFEYEGEPHAESRHAEPSSLVAEAPGTRARDARALGANPGAAAARAGQADRPRRPRRRGRAGRARHD